MISIPYKTHTIYVYGLFMFIYLHLVDLVDVGKYTILMDAMGYIDRDSARFTHPCLLQLHSALKPRSWNTLTQDDAQKQPSPKQKLSSNHHRFHGVMVYQKIHLGSENVSCREGSA